jgi:O-glycosyl hydrolase
MVIVDRSGYTDFNGCVYTWLLGGQTASMNPWTSSGDTYNSGTFLYDSANNGYVWINVLNEPPYNTNLPAGDVRFALTRTGATG